MKYILEDGRTLDTLREKYGRNLVTMSGFFFHNREANLTQKPLDSLLRSILFQILFLNHLAPFTEVQFHLAIVIPQRNVVCVTKVGTKNINFGKI
jgi:hypothetical protein